MFRVSGKCLLLRFFIFAILICAGDAQDKLELVMASRPYKSDAFWYPEPSAKQHAEWNGSNQALHEAAQRIEQMGALTQAESYTLGQCLTELLDLFDAIMEGNGEIQPMLVDVGLFNTTFLSAYFVGSEDWAWQMVDSSGKIPDGIFAGALYSPGIAYQCLSTEFPNRNPEDHSINMSVRTDQTAYCPVLFKSDPSMSQDTTFNFSSIFPEGTTFKNALCVPRSCAKPKENLEVALAAFVQESGISGLAVSVMNCWDTDNLNPTVSPYQVIIIIILAAFIILAALGTLCLQLHRANNPEDPLAKKTGKYFQTLTAFSVVANTESLLRTKSSNETITCLGGIRVFSLLWVFFGHNYSNDAMSEIYKNPTYYLDFVKNWLYLTLYGGSAAVDSFFVMSGLLVAYILLKEMDKNEGKFNAVYYYVHRYIRLTPLYAINFAVWVALYPLMSESPRQHEDLGKEFLQSQCQYWWSNLLYIHNLFGNIDYNMNYCYDHGWFLSVDMQLYVLVPFVMAALYYLDKRGARGTAHLWMFFWIVMSVAIPVSFLYAMPEIPVRSGPAGIPNKNSKTNGDLGWLMSLKPFWRFAPFACGAWGGYILYKLRGKELQLPSWLVTTLWAAILTTFPCALYFNAEYLVLKSDNVADVTFMPRQECANWFQTIMYNYLYQPPDHQTQIQKLKSVRVVSVAKSAVNPFLAARTGSETKLNSKFGRENHHMWPAAGHTQLRICGQ